MCQTCIECNLRIAGDRHGNIGPMVSDEPFAQDGEPLQVCDECYDYWDGRTLETEIRTDR